MIEFSNALKIKQISDIKQTETEEGLLLSGVPVFEAGKYRGKVYDEKFLDDKIIKNFLPDEDVPVMANHSDNSFDTLGYVKSLRRENKMLLSDLLLIDDNAINRWKKKLMKKFSVSLYPSGYDEPEGKLREISFVAFPHVKGASVHSEKLEAENIDEYELSEFRKWSQKEKNDLPDSAFLLTHKPIKDKSKDRSLPVKGPDGQYDEAHVKNAMSRINQVQGFSDEEMSSAKKRLKAIAKKLGIEVSSEFNDIPDINLEVVDKMADNEKELKQIMDEFAAKEKKFTDEKTVWEKEKTDFQSKITEKDTSITKLTSDIEAYKKKEKDDSISKKIEEFKKAGKIIPAQEVTMKEHMSKLSDADLKSFCDVIEKSTPAVKFDEAGQQTTTTTAPKASDMSVKDILALADKQSKETGVDFWTCYNNIFKQ